MPDVGFCRDCRWWDAPYMREGRRVAQCKAAGDSEMMVAHGVHTEGFLVTREDFGCVEFTPKEPAPPCEHRWVTEVEPRGYDDLWRASRQVTLQYDGTELRAEAVFCARCGVKAKGDG